MRESDVKTYLEQIPSIDGKEISSILKNLKDCPNLVRPNDYHGVHYYLLDGYHMWLSSQDDPCGTTCFYTARMKDGDYVTKLDEQCPNSGLDIYKIELMA